MLAKKALELVRMVREPARRLKEPLNVDPMAMVMELKTKAMMFAMEALLVLSITIVSVMTKEIPKMIATMFVRAVSATMDMASRAVTAATAVEASTRLFSISRSSKSETLRLALKVDVASKALVAALAAEASTELHSTRRSEKFRLVPEADMVSKALVAALAAEASRMLVWDNKPVLVPRDLEADMVSKPAWVARDLEADLANRPVLVAKDLEAGMANRPVASAAEAALANRPAWVAKDLGAILVNKPAWVA